MPIMSCSTSGITKQNLYPTLYWVSLYFDAGYVHMKTKSMDEKLLMVFAEATGSNGKSF